MVKAFELEDLDCAHCAGIIEEKIRGLKAVNSATLNFMSRRLVVEAEEKDFSGIIKDMKKIIKKTEPDVTLVEK